MSRLKDGENIFFCDLLDEILRFMLLVTSKCIFPRNQIFQGRKDVAVGSQIIKPVLYIEKSVHLFLSPVLFRGYNNKSRTRASFKVDFRKLRQLIEIPYSWINLISMLH